MLSLGSPLDFFSSDHYRIRRVLMKGLFATPALHQDGLTLPTRLAWYGNSPGQARSFFWNSFSPFRPHRGKPKVTFLLLHYAALPHRYPAVLLMEWPRTFDFDFSPRLSESRVYHPSKLSPCLRLPRHLQFIPWFSTFFTK